MAETWSTATPFSGDSRDSPADGPSSSPEAYLDLCTTLTEMGAIPSLAELQSVRYLNRSILPHLSALRKIYDPITDAESDKPFGESSNPKNRRTAAALYYTPQSQIVISAILEELGRLGFEWKCGPISALDWGAGGGGASQGILEAARLGRAGLPTQGKIALIEQDKGILEIALKWLDRSIARTKLANYSLRGFHRKVDYRRDLLPRTAPRFNLWVASRSLLEAGLSEAELAKKLVKTWRGHLADDGICILVESGRNHSSRKLLNLRKELLDLPNFEKHGFKILTPCMGSQACGALAEPHDFCHEEVMWWRPKLVRQMDQKLGWDSKKIGFSYLVVAQSEKTLSELLPNLSRKRVDRIVSPVRAKGRDLDFYLCGPDQKKRIQFRSDAELARGDLLLDADVEVGPELSRVKACSSFIGPLEN